MKLKNYLSAKRLKRKLSKANVNASQGSINDSFTDFNDNDLPSATITKDDMFLRPKRDGAIGVRSDMTQSFSGCLPSYQSQLVQTEIPLDMSYRDYGSQTDLQLSTNDICQAYSPISADPDQYFYKDSMNNVELGVVDYEDRIGRCLCPGSNIRCDVSSDYHYHSLPSNQTSHHPIQDIHYNSLPSAMTQSVYVGSAQPQPTAQVIQCDRWKRSRIKTNPWLPLPKKINAETLRRTRKVSSRAEPRLSRFFSEVEQLMREQLSPTVEEWPEVDAYLSNESLASTCSTATEIPERKVSYSAVGSPSEGYKSACGSSDLNLADTESLSDTSRSSSASDLSKHCSDPESSRSITSHCPPSLHDFNASLKADSNWTSSSSSLISESMFASTYSSPKYEALEDKVRRLCQSTSDLDEKMRQARLECSYIQTLS